MSYISEEVIFLKNKNRKYIQKEFDFKRKSMSVRIASIGLRRRNPHPHR